MSDAHSKRWRILVGDVRLRLRDLAPESVHCVVTSPPYWGLRDYGVPGQLGLEERPDCLGWVTKAPCGECFVCHMVAVFREVKRVLRDDGTLWLNLGDSFASSTKGSGGVGKSGLMRDGRSDDGRRTADAANARAKYETRGFDLDACGLKPKDLVGIPWRVAFALQADGWYLRSDIIWHKPNPMPESVTDRPTKSHEYLFLFSKSPAYYYDHIAVKEEAVWQRKNDPKWNEARAATNEKKGMGNRNGKDGGFGGRDPGQGRNRRSVWSIATKPFKGAHFATFPPDLVEPCILAGTSEHGCCATCAAPYERVVEKGDPDPSRPQAARAMELAQEHGLTEAHIAAIRAVGTADAGKALHVMTGAGRNAEETQRLADEAKVALGGYFREFTFGTTRTTGWRSTCSCEPLGRQPAVVLDPFNGAATTGVVALKHGLYYIGIELNEEYVDIGILRLFDAERKR